MSLKVWIDENSTLYVAGQDDAGSYDQSMPLVPAHEVLKAVNAHIDEVGEYHRVTLADAFRFSTIWVFPEAIEKEVWASDDFAETFNREEDGWFKEKGWIPVMTVEVVTL